MTSWLVREEEGAAVSQGKSETMRAADGMFGH